MKKNLLHFSVLIILICSSFSNPENEVVEKFEKLLKAHFDSYNTNPRETITMLGGGWVKEKYLLDGDYNYDVQNTNSLVIPFTGTCEFTLKRVLLTIIRQKMKP